ncbi:MAG: DUF1570 domain-containing protein [Planctomycetes bacterium]|nr:DUF1570 domain-containing protein [Planctomycetota bacterium]
MAMAGSLAACLVVGSSGWAAQSADAKFFAERAKARSDQAQLRAEAQADHIKRAENAAKVFGKIIEYAKQDRVAGQDAMLAHFLTAIGRLDTATADRLRGDLVALPPEPASSPAPQVKKWEHFMEERRRELFKRLQRLLDAAVDAGLTDVAYEFLHEALTFDPDNPSLRASISQVQVDGEWYGPKSLPMAKAGLHWDRTLGWEMTKDAARYEAGEFYDLQTKSWTNLSKANVAHASLAKPWVIQSEHLEVRGNAELTDLVKVTNDLEQFYAQIFAAYASFFTQNKADYRLILGMVDHPRLVVNVFRDEEDYKKSLPVDAGWSAGMFISSTGQSYFYAGSTHVVYHEFTHQVLHMFTGKDSSPAWLCEGIAEYSESPTFEDGEMALGRISASEDLKEYLIERDMKRAMSLDQLMAITSGEKWSDAVEPEHQYNAACALVHYCMEAEARRYRSDFIAFLKDSYLGLTAGHKLWDYLGVTKDQFEHGFNGWVLSALDDKTMEKKTAPKKTR